MKQFFNQTAIVVFLQIFIPLIIVFGGISLLVSWNESINYKQKIIGKAERVLSLQQKSFDVLIKNNMQDLIFLEKLTKGIIAEKETSMNVKVKQLEKLFYLFVSVQPGYDQIRYINANGMEVIRINNRHGAPFIVPTGLLQNKKHRPYFYHTIQLPENNIYVSPLEPNVEQRKVEIPVIPVIRMAAPVTIAKKNVGIIIINYDARNFIDILKQSDSSKFGISLLIDSDGYFIVGSTALLEWGNVFSDRKDKKMSVLYPKAWNEISQGKTGTITTATGDILLVKDLSKIAEQYIQNVFKENINLKLMLYIPQDRFEFGLFYYFTIFALLLGFIVTISVLWTMFRLKKIAYDMQMEKLATIDNLTQVANRNKLFTTIEREIARSSRYNSIVSFLMLDIDSFKKVNDVFGHVAGDKVLQELAKKCSAIIRKTDILGRFGGEEFIIVSPETNLEQAMILAEKIRAEVEKLKVFYEDKVINFTVSIGVAVLHEGETNLQGLIRRMDSALYAAKNNGRNKVVSEKSL